MVFEQIEKLKQDFTDKYVVVNADRAELRRFRSLTGIVRTVNMNGRALVEFDGLQNIGWYDIDLDFLEVVDKPAPAPESKEKKPAKKPPAKKAPEKKAAAKPAAAADAGMSVADVLAAARGDSPAAESKAPKEKGSPASMSVADVLAAARGDAKPEEPAEPDPEPTPEAESVAEEVAEEVEEKIVVESTGDLPTDIEGILAYCREVDG